MALRIRRPPQVLVVFSLLCSHAWSWGRCAEQIKFEYMYHDFNSLPVALGMGCPLRSPQMWASGRCNSAKISSWFFIRFFLSLSFICLFISFNWHKIVFKQRNQLTHTHTHTHSHTHTHTHTHKTKLYGTFHKVCMSISLYLLFLHRNINVNLYCVYFLLF